MEILMIMVIQFLAELMMAIDMKAEQCRFIGIILYISKLINPKH